MSTAWCRTYSVRCHFTQTARSLKLSIPADFCGKDIAKSLLFSGYASGSTLGGSSTLLAYMLTQCSKHYPWNNAKVKAFLRSVARIKAVFVVYQNGFSRSIDAWRALVCFWLYMVIVSLPLVAEHDLTCVTHACILCNWTWLSSHWSQHCL